MFSEYVHNNYKRLMDTYRNPSKKELNPLQDRNNIVGSIVIRKSNNIKELALFNLLYNQTKLLDRLYVHLDLEDYPNKELDIEFNLQWVLDYFSDVIEIIWHPTYSKFNHLSLYPKHAKDSVFFFDADFDYDNYTIEKTISMKQERLILNLSKDIYHKRRVYDDAIVLFNTNDGSENFHERNKDAIDSKNMLTEDIFIAPYMIEDSFNIEELKFEYANNWEVFLTLYAFQYEYDVWNIGLNHRSFVPNNNDMVLYKYLKLHPAVLEKWCKTYPGYSIFDSDDVSCENVFKGKLEVDIINFNIPEMAIENVNNIHHRMLKIPDKVKVLDVSTKELYYMWANHWSMYIHKDIRNKFEYDDNTGNQVFDKIVPKRDEQEHYGFLLYQQSVKYLIENSDADYLFIFNGKCKLMKSIYFNDNCIMNQFGEYLKIFNLKLMREKGIKFESFEQFKIACRIAKCDIEELKVANKLQCLPENFDKFNSTVLATLHYRRHIMKKWIKEHYNKEFDNDYSRDY